MRKNRVWIFFHRLAVKWMFLVAIVVLPINVLTLIMANMMNNAYQDNIAASYKARLNMYCKQLEAEFSAVQNMVADFLTSENVGKLDHGSGEDPAVEVTRFKRNLTRENAWCRYPGLCGVWDKERDIVHIFHERRTYSRDEEEAAKEMLRMGYDGGLEKGEWVFAAGGGEGYIAQLLDFKRFGIAVMVDAEAILEEYYGLFEENHNILCLADGEGRIRAKYSAEGMEIVEDEMNMDAFLADGSKVVFSQAVEVDGFQLVQVCDKQVLMHHLPTILGIIYALAIVCLVCLPLVCIFSVRLVIRPLIRLVGGMRKLESGDLHYHLEGKTGTTELEYLFLSFNHMVDKLNDMVIASYEREIVKLQTESINMRLTVNQHMLLNFLNTIYSLSLVGKNEEIGDFSLLLMKYFRYVLRQDGGLVTMAEEMEFVQDYLKLQGMRFPDSFTYVYYMEDEVGKVKIPQLLIENFAENAVKYGLVMGSEIEIVVNARLENGKLICSVCDTGNGIKADVLEKIRKGQVIEDSVGKHIGIWNCRRRLQYYYGNDFTLEITSAQGEGTQVWMELPLEPVDSEKAAMALHNANIFESQAPHQGKRSAEAGEEYEDESTDCR